MSVVYINLYKSSKIVGKKEVYIKDLADISASEEVKEKINNLCVFKPEQKEPKNYVINLVHIIDIIRENMEELDIESIGENQALLDYKPKEETPNKFFEYMKLGFVMMVVFAGGLVAIMAYQTDVSLRKTFSILYEALTGISTGNPVWITIPYSIGMPIGIIVFFNHFGQKKFTSDPTPIQIEINSYEAQSDDTIIDTITDNEREQKK